MNPFDDIFKHVELALRAGAYLPALFTVLTLPDICAAMESDDDERLGARYRWWVDTFLPAYPGAELWQFRCRLLHQATAFLPDAPTPVRYFFVDPGHGSIRGMSFVTPLQERAAAIDINHFVAEVSHPPLVASRSDADAALHPRARCPDALVHKPALSASALGRRPSG